MRVPEAKLEDVFKRVRLGVRRRTNGQQIPWESTSLEDDFWFVPPKELKRLSEAEAAREFEVELAIWEKIKASKEPGPLEDYLRKYPSGRFSELAMLQLNRLLEATGEKRIEIASQQDNPFTKGTIRADTRFRIGDSYHYRQIDRFTRIETDLGKRTVVEFGESTVRFDDDSVIDLLGNRVSNAYGVYQGDQTYLSDYSTGKRWKTSFRITRPNGSIGLAQAEFHVAAQEIVRVPAGNFDAFRIDGKGHVNWNYGRSTVQQYRQWLAPNVRLRVAYELLSSWAGWGGVSFNHREELIAYEQQV